MPDSKISALTNGAPAQGTDIAPFARGAGNVRLTNADIAAYIATLSQTMTNKTLTAPVISTIVNTGTITLPTATTTLVGRDTTDTLTNKTINASNNTVSNLTTAMFEANVVDTDSTLAASSDTRLPSQNAIKSYVDNLVTGLSWKPAVRVATTANGALATAFANGQTVDGVVLATGNRILIKNQTTQTENGIYTVNASGAPTRALDANTGAELVNATVFVSEGTANADEQWTCTTNSPITIGSTNLTFVQVAGAGTYTNGTGLSLTGNTFAIDATVATLTGAQTLTNKSLTAPTLTGLTLQTATSATTAVLSELENLSTASNTTKSVAWDLYGRDTVNARKNIGRVICGPDDGNWVGAYLDVYTRTADAITAKARFTSAGGLTFLTNTGRLTGNSTTGVPIQGVGTNSNAAAGDVGEYFISESNNSTATVTITIATPGVISWTAHGRQAGSVVNFTTTGALPTGLVAGTNYYVCAGATLLANSFTVATSVANALAGTNIATSGTQSGVHTGISATANLTTNVGVDVAGLSLTAGDWDVCFNGWTKGATTAVLFSMNASVSQTSGTLSTTPSNNSKMAEATTTYGNGDAVNLVTPAVRISLSATTTIFGVISNNFGTAATQAYGALMARRVR